MDVSDAAGLFFSGMEKLGPGDNASTRHALSLLPKRNFRTVVDAGCGTGRQTLVLAKALNTQVHAVDCYQPFLSDLATRAREAHIEHLVQTHCMDMAVIPQVFRDIDLLWSEGAAYNIGFSNALATWASCIVAGGFAVVSELTWLKEKPPAAVTEFFRSGYPDMQSVEQNVATAERAGYGLVGTFRLPGEAWVEGYYEVLAPRARSLLEHPSSVVRDFAAETLREIEIFQISEDSYGYVFYVLRRPFGRPDE